MLDRRDKRISLSDISQDLRGLVFGLDPTRPDGGCVGPKMAFPLFFSRFLTRNPAFSPKRLFRCPEQRPAPLGRQICQAGRAASGLAAHRHAMPDLLPPAQARRAAVAALPLAQITFFLLQTQSVNIEFGASSARIIGNARSKAVFDGR